MSATGPKPNSESLLDWLENDDSVSSFLPPFLDDPYSYSSTSTDYHNQYQWWDEEQQLIQTQTQPQTQHNPSQSLPSTTVLIDPCSETNTGKRKQSQNPQTKTPNKPNRSRNELNNPPSSPNTGESPCNNDDERPTKKSHSNSNKDSRWAEQLLNPCAVAIDAGNVPRIQHLLYVLHDLSSVSGDANHRLAAYGLKALTFKLSHGSANQQPISTFSSIDQRLFHKSLIKFHELTPWFTFIYTLANAALLETLNRAHHHRPNLHLLDIGVSHGVQWPTLMEALARRAAGPPPLLRLTIAGDDARKPLSAGPPGDDFPSRLQRYAKTINLNLQIKVLNQSLESLTSEALELKDNETLVVCAQFRLHQLKEPDRNGVLRFLREIKPELMVLSENDCDHCCSNEGFASGFSRRVDFLWRFLDSTSVGFKGRECEERRVIEGEAALALLSEAEMNEGHLQWRDRMKGIGFVEEGFSVESMESGKIFLRKYDCNWEIRVDEKSVSLCWKGQPVSFCSLWKVP